MSNGEQQRNIVVSYWWEKAEDSLLSAERELDAGALVFSINRLYYALYYAVSAVLLRKEFTFSKHSGVRAAFHREIIKTGLMNTEWGRLYDQLFEDRHEGDYVALTDFDKLYVEEKLMQCRQFLLILKKVE
jgi:uncharacterized protein